MASLKEYQRKLEEFGKREDLTIFGEFLFSASMNTLLSYLETGDIEYTPMTEEEYKERDALEPKEELPDE